MESVFCCQPGTKKDPWAEDKKAGGCGCKQGSGSRGGVRGDNSWAAKGQRSKENSRERSTGGLHRRQNSTVNWTRAVPSPYSPMSCALDQQSQGAETQAQLQTQSRDVIFKVSCCLGLALRFDNRRYSQETTSLTRGQDAALKRARSYLKLWFFPTPAKVWNHFLQGEILETPHR